MDNVYMSPVTLSELGTSDDTNRPIAKTLSKTAVCYIKNRLTQL